MRRLKGKLTAVVLLILLSRMAWCQGAPANQGTGASAAYNAGRKFQASGDFWSALEQYQIADRADPAMAWPIKQMADCYYLLGDPAKAAETYARYLALNPGDTKSAAFYEYLQGRVQSGAAPPAPLNPDGEQLAENPRDKKHFMIQHEVLTPVVFGFDFSYFINKNINVGLGLTMVPTNSYVFHPRFRYYQAKWYWSPFVELGAVYFSGPVPGDPTLNMGVLAGDLGFGVNVIDKGPMTLEFLLSLTAGNFHTQYRTYQSYYDPYPRVTDYSTPFAIPLIGFGWGFVF